MQTLNYYLKRTTRVTSTLITNSLLYEDERWTLEEFQKELGVLHESLQPVKHPIEVKANTSEIGLRMASGEGYENVVSLLMSN